MAERQYSNGRATLMSHRDSNTEIIRKGVDMKIRGEKERGWKGRKGQRRKGDFTFISILSSIQGEKLLKDRSKLRILTKF